jgi:hypothetical protein
MRRFGGPDKEMRSISRADKLCRSNGVGMSAANDLAVAEAEGPLGPEAHTGLLYEVKSCNEAHATDGGRLTIIAHLSITSQI